MKKNYLFIFLLLHLNGLHSSENLPCEIEFFYSPYYLEKTPEEYLIKETVNKEDLGDVYFITRLNEEKIREDFSEILFEEFFFDKKLITTKENFKKIFYNQEDNDVCGEIIETLNNMSNHNTYFNYKYSENGVYGLGVNEYNGSGRTNLMIGLDMDLDSFIKSLKTNKSFDFNLQSFNGKTILMLALEKKLKRKYIRFIMDKYFSLVQDVNGKTILSRIIADSSTYNSIYAKYESKFKDALLENKISDYDEMTTILNNILSSTDYVTIDSLVNKRPVLEVFTAYKDNLLLWAIDKGFIDLVQKIIDLDLEFSLNSQDFETKQMALVKSFCKKESRWFFSTNDDSSDNDIALSGNLKSGPGIYGKRNDHIIEEDDSKNYLITKELLNVGFSPNQQNSKGNTVLFILLKNWYSQAKYVNKNQIYKNNLTLLKLLLENNADTSKVDNKNRSFKVYLGKIYLKGEVGGVDTVILDEINELIKENN